MDEPSDGVDEPSDGVDEPSDGVDEPSDGVDEPSDGVDEPSDSVDQPTGAVEGAVGTPGITPPPTDTQLVATAPAPSSDGWRLILALIAFILVGTVTFPTRQGARHRA